ncbi:MAG: exonuclease [Nitrospirae bacterium]|nr:exonuclease [Nitrospirota bacterium]
MIQNSFCILDGIGEKKERRLWKEGIVTWDDFLDADKLLTFSDERKRLFDESLFLFQKEFDARNAGYFSREVKRREQWRLFETFRDDTVCLDIETSGLQPQSGGYVTVVGLYDGHDYKCFVHGRNLSTDILNKELSNYKFLITFYGAAFDIPFLQRTFPGIDFSMPHFDLCFGAKRLKIQGGLKKIEHDFGIERDESVQGLDGYDAVKMWEQSRAGSTQALDRLIQYNREDTVNLMQIAPVLYERLKQSTGIEEYLACGVA